MFGVPLVSLVFVVAVVGAALGLMAWLLAGIPDLQPRPRLITDLDLDALLDDTVESDLDEPTTLDRPTPVDPTPEPLCA